MRKYVGYYEGYWRANLRKVTMSLKDGALHATGPADSGSGAVDP
jgi:hypothetical protein